jgi:hypothetical protein
MNAQEQQQDEALNAIGRELYEIYYLGKLDFEQFKALFHRAIAVCGPDDDSMEMFCHYARGDGWWDWMMQELQKAPSQRVA